MTPSADGQRRGERAGRIVALDSLRGVAAVSVVVYHCLLVWPDLFETLGGGGVPFFRTGQDPVVVALLTTTPPSLLWSGREAVLLFFVLSGFVLAQGFLRGMPPYLPFMARRACRLLLPCAAVTLPVALLVALLDPEPGPGWSAWTLFHWGEPVTPRLVAAHALLLEQPYGLNSPLWSLHHEWRVSLLFPLLVLLARLGRGAALAVGLGAAAAGAVEGRLLGTDWLSTLVYVPHFMLGVLLAREGPGLPARIAALAPRWRHGLWLLCYLLLTYRWLAPGPALALDLVNGAGAALLIALILSSPRAQRLLCARPLVWLGDVSFSLYLVHVPVILAALHLAPDGLPTWTALAGAALLSFPVAWAVFHLAERPSIRLGRALSERVGPGRARAKARSA